MYKLKLQLRKSVFTCRRFFSSILFYVLLIDISVYFSYTDEDEDEEEEEKKIHTVCDVTIWFLAMKEKK